MHAAQRLLLADMLGEGSPWDLSMMENCAFVQGTPIKKMVKYATARGFTDVAVFNENQKHVNGLLLIHLPNGPTAHFKLSSLKLSKDIKVDPFLHTTYLMQTPQDDAF